MASIACIYVFVSNNRYYIGDDLSYHLNRIQGISDALKDGQKIPRIYPNINYGYGYGSPLFYCDFFLYPFVFLNFLGVSVLGVYKTIIVFYTLAAIFLSMYFSKKVFKTTASCLIGGVLFTLSNYRLYDVYNRAALGEVIALSFAPFILYSIYQTLVLKEKNHINLALSFSSLVLSHLISAVLFGFMFFIFILIFIIYNIKNKDVILHILKTIVKATALAFLLCSWFLLPMVEQIWSQDFYCFSSNSSFSSYPRIESIKIIINPFSNLNVFDILLFALSFMYLFVKKNKVITILLIFSIFIFLIMLGVFPVPKTIYFIQFMFRLNIIIYPISIIIIQYAYLECRILKPALILVVIFLIFNIFNKYSMLFNDTKNSFNINDLESFIENDDEHDYYNKRQLAGGEYLPICDNADYINGEKNIILEDIYGSCIDTTNEFNRSHTHIVFSYAGEAKFASLPLTYYKGYTVLCDNEEIDCIDDFLYKRVGFYLQPGLHRYSVCYGGTFIQHKSTLLSIISLIYVIIRCIYKREIPRNHI